MGIQMEHLFFDEIKELRETYFIQYKPPVNSFPFANLHLIFYQKTDAKTVAEAMERELNLWVTKYPIPLMVFAWDDTDSPYDLSTVRPCNSLIGYLDKNKNEIRMFWALLKNDQIPNDAFDIEYLKLVYYDIPYKTAQEKSLGNIRRYKNIQTGLFILSLWLVIVPVIVAFINVIIPYWLQVLVFIYCAYKAFLVALDLLGKRKKSKREKEREQKQLKMEHYYYHCELNPEGFIRLKQENFERMSKQGIQKEVSELKLNKK